MEETRIRRSLKNESQKESRNQDGKRKKRVQMIWIHLERRMGGTGYRKRDKKRRRRKEGVEEE